MIRQFPLIATFGLAITLLAVVTLQGQQSTVAPAKVAVVDVQKVFQSLDERAAVDADLTQQAERLQKEEQERTTALKALEADLNILAKDTDAYDQTMAKAEQMAIELQAWRKVKQRRLEQERTIRVQELYNKIIEASQRLAQKQGYDMVLQKDTQNFRPDNQQQLTAMILGRKVLWVNDALDISDTVNQMLNNEYNNRVSKQ